MCSKPASSAVPRPGPTERKSSGPFPSDGFTGGLRMRLLNRFALVLSLSGLLAGLWCGFSAGGDAEGPALLVQSGTITGRVLDNGLVASVRAAAPMGNLIVSTWGSMISKKPGRISAWPGRVSSPALPSGSSNMCRLPGMLSRSRRFRSKIPAPGASPSPSRGSGTRDRRGSSLRRETGFSEQTLRWIRQGTPVSRLTE